MTLEIITTTNLAAIIGGAFWLGSLNNRVAYLSNEVEKQEAAIAAHGEKSREEWRDELKDLRGVVAIQERMINKLRETQSDSISELRVLVAKLEAALGRNGSDSST